MLRVATDALWDPKLTNKERFGNLSGKALQEAMFDAYRVEDQALLPYFDSEGRPLLRRHITNNRQQDQVKARYVAGVLKSGVIDGVRGNPWAVKGVDGVFELISFATLAEAVYEAHRQAPDNEQVKLSVSR